MNPFIFSPRKITTAAAAKYAIAIYMDEATQARAIRNGIEENLAAILDVLVKAHPDQEADLQLLIDHARYAGHADGRVQELQTLESQFRTALPWAIKKELSA